MAHERINWDVTQSKETTAEGGGASRGIYVMFDAKEVMEATKRKRNLSARF